MSAPENMPNFPGLVLRGSTYYYRRVVPQDLRDSFGQREVLRTLRTGNKADARSRAMLVAAEIETDLARHRAQIDLECSPKLDRLTPEQIKRVEDAYYAHLLNAEVFYSLREAQVLIERWRRHYNTVRPHSSLSYRPPAPETFVPIDHRPTMH